MGLPGGASGEEPACQYRRCRRPGFDPWVRKIPWRSVWQPTPVFLPEKFHGQRSLAGYSPEGRKESDTTEVTQQQQQQEGSLGKKGHMHIRAESLCSAPETVTALSISYVCVCAEPFQLCPTFWGPKDHSPPGCPIHGILQAKILEWVAISSRGSSQVRDQAHISFITCTGRQVLHH